jgi:hypothetical protein
VEPNIRPNSRLMLVTSGSTSVRCRHMTAGTLRSVLWREADLATPRPPSMNAH